MGRVADGRSRVDVRASAAVRRKLAIASGVRVSCAALLVPQRTSALGSDAALAEDIAADLTATVVELKQQELITPAEEKTLEEEIERIRRAAQEAWTPLRGSCRCAA